jgi:REP element-mobilizing transposase RayT
MEYIRNAHSVYLLTYHIVFVTKYIDSQQTEEHRRKYEKTGRYSKKRHR